MDFGTVPVGHTVGAATFQVGDSGTVALVVTRSLAPTRGLRRPAPGAETRINPGTYLQQTVTFTPTAVGPTTGRYTFNSNTGQGYVSVALSERVLTTAGADRPDVMTAAGTDGRRDRVSLLRSP